eukprot:5588026-Alexandrium_andersonii.AAC.1
MAPDASQFRSVWQIVRKRNMGDQVEHEALFRNKVRKTVYCLGEACRDITREFFAKACSCTLSQDGGASRQLARFTAADAALNTRSGVL